MPAPDPGELPEALATPRPRWSISFVWLIPLVAALIGGWLGWRALSERGPTVRIVFGSAEGLEAAKTRVKYRDVDVGHIAAVSLSEDRRSVVVTVAFAAGTEDLLVEDTRFWVVRPRVAGGSVSGLSTLLSGAYIGMDVGTSKARKRDFAGLDTPPQITSGKPGSRFVLRGEDLGSLDVGSPVLFRRLSVGRVIGYELNEDGSSVSVQVFVDAPHDRHVRQETRFWHESGLDVSLDAGGVRLDTQSLASLVLGGVSFTLPPGASEGERAASGSAFVLHPDREAAYARNDLPREPYVLYFADSVRGLTIGAPVEFRGIPLGKVTGVGIEFDRRARDLRIPVQISLQPERITTRGDAQADAAAENQGGLIERLVARGLRAQLRTGNLITGQLYVALDFFPKAGPGKVNRATAPPELPTMPGALQALGDRAEALLERIERLPFDQVIAELRTAIASLDSTLTSIDRTVRRVDQELAPEARQVLEEARGTIREARGAIGAAERVLKPDAPLQQDARETLREVSRAADAIRVLADFLERHPEALLRGKREEP